MAKRNALGRGLGALIEDATKVENYQQPGTSAVSEIEISNIEANPYQPRLDFEADSLEELAQSIRELGIIQPITLRQVINGSYQIIAGERRFRAAKIAGLNSVPAYVRTADNNEMLEMALVENIQREDLDAIEIAISYQHLIDECELTQENLSEKVGKKRSTISNYLRLLKLPAVIQKGIRLKKISMGHARALVNVKEPEAQVFIFEEIIKHDLSVRKVEELVRNLTAGKAPEKDAPKSKYPQEYEDLNNHLSKFFQTKVNFKVNDTGKGKIEIPFNSSNDLERIISIFDKLHS